MRRRRSLPQVVIPVPCHVDWNSMTRIDREGRTRFCDTCERPVYDSKAMSRGELADLIARHEGRRLPCVRLHRRPDGTIVTKDCLARFLRAGRWLWVKVALGAAAFWAAVLGLRPLALFVSRHPVEREVTLELHDTVIQGMMFRIVRDRDPASLARLSPAVARPRAIPDLGIRPRLPKIDRAAPLRYLAADEDIRKLVEPAARGR
jgi:hypothetical protein